MGLVVRLVAVTFVVLAFMLVIRAGICRLFPVREVQPSSKRTRILAWMDRAIAKVRRIAFGGLALILFVTAARVAALHEWTSHGASTSERAQAR